MLVRSTYEDGRRSSRLSFFPCPLTRQLPDLPVPDLSLFFSPDGLSTPSFSELNDSACRQSCSSRAGVSAFFSFNVQNCFIFPAASRASSPNRGTRSLSSLSEKPIFCTPVNRRRSGLSILSLRYLFFAVLLGIFPSVLKLRFPVALKSSLNIESHLSPSFVPQSADYLGRASRQALLSQLPARSPRKSIQPRLPHGAMLLGGASPLSRTVRSSPLFELHLTSLMGSSPQIRVLLVFSESSRSSPRPKRAGTLRSFSFFSLSPVRG